MKERKETVLCETIILKELPDEAPAGENVLPDAPERPFLREDVKRPPFLLAGQTLQVVWELPEFLPERRSPGQRPLPGRR